MHVCREHRLNIAPLLLPPGTPNTLEITIHPAALVAAELAADYPYTLTDVSTFVSRSESIYMVL